MNILVTGDPGVGKTTLVKKLCGDLSVYRPTGFYTAEIREGGIRRGFELVGLHGRKGLLAHLDVHSGYRVGRYGVDVIGFEEFLRSIPFEVDPDSPVVIDEIGKMECHSGRFRSLVEGLLASDRVVVATIAQRGGGFISRVKQRADLLVFEVTRFNREALYPRVRKTVLEALAERGSSGGSPP